MQFLKTLFWVALAVVLSLFCVYNWHPVTINLWGGLQLDIKLPLLVIGAFILGFLPTFLLYRARLWSLRRRIELQERNAAMALAPPQPGDAGAEDRPTVDLADQRLSGQSTVSPA